LTGASCESGESLREQIPARGVIAAAEARDCGPVEDGLNAAAHAGRRFRLGRPDRFECLDDQLQVDVLHRQLAEHRRDIGPERGGPLCGVLQVPPLAAVLFQVGVAAFVKSSRLAGLDRSGGSLRFPVLDRIDAFRSQLAAPPCGLTCLGE